MNSSQRYNKRQITYWMNMLADHGDSFDEMGRDILAKIKFHSACLKAHTNKNNYDKY